MNLLLTYKEFEKRYSYIKNINNGEVNRENMPVIKYKDTEEFDKLIKTLSAKSVKEFQEKLDVNIKDEEFDFKKFIKNEIPYIYFERTEDKKKQIKTATIKKEAKLLFPIQNELFLEKIISNIIKYGIPSEENFITKRTLVVSKNNFIIDGHHRWLTTMIFKPELELEMLKIQMSLNELYTVLMAYNTKSKISY